jgi:hypothetical protein
MRATSASSSACAVAASGIYILYKACVGSSRAPCVVLRCLVRLRFALRSLAMWRVCAIAPTAVALFPAGGPFLPSLYVNLYFTQREAEDISRQPETKRGATANTRPKAKPRNAKRSQNKNAKSTHGLSNKPPECVQTRNNELAPWVSGCSSVFFRDCNSSRCLHRSITFVTPSS